MDVPVHEYYAIEGEAMLVKGKASSKIQRISSSRYRNKD